MHSRFLLHVFILLQCLLLEPRQSLAIRFLDHTLPSWGSFPSCPPSTAVFALGSFWRGEAVFGCLTGVIRTTAGYTGGLKPNPEYRNTGGHAESVEVEYNSQIIRYEQLLDAFWSSHDPTQVFGQGPDVGDQYRSAIFVQGLEQESLASLSKEREEAKLKDGVLTTEIESLGVFYPAEPEHQKFELRRNPMLMRLLGSMAEEGLARSRLATRLNAYSAGMCPLSMRKSIDDMVKGYLKSIPNLHQIISG